MEPSDTHDEESLFPWSPFKRVMVVQAAHAAGDALVAISLAGTLFFSVPSGQARGRVGLYLLLTMTPFALLSPVVGPMLDRWRGSYRIGIFIAAAGRMVLAFLMASRTQRLVLYPLAFSVLVLSRTHGVSRGALVPDVLPEGRSLVSVNARLSIVSVAAGTLIAIPGVGIQKWLGSGATLRFAAVVFFFAAAVAIGLPGPKRSRREARAESNRHALLTPRLLAGGIATAASRAALGFLVFLLAFVLREKGEGARGFGLVLGAAAIGGFVGSVVVARARFLLREPVILLGSLLGIAVVAFLSTSRFNLRTAIAVAVVTGTGTTAARLSFDALVQKDAPEEVRARTFARYETIFQLCWVAGAGLATAIHFGSANGFRAVGAICIAGIVFATRSAMIRSSRRGSMQPP